MRAESNLLAAMTFSSITLSVRIAPSILAPLAPPFVTRYRTYWVQPKEPFGPSALARLVHGETKISLAINRPLAEAELSQGSHPKRADFDRPARE